MTTATHVEDSTRRFVKRLANDTRDEAGFIPIGIRQGYVLPTRKGLYYAVTLVVMFLWIVNYGINIGYLILFFAAVFGLLVAVMTVRNLTNIRFKPLPNQAVYAGDTAYFRIKARIDNKENKIQLVARSNGEYSRVLSAEKGSDSEFAVPRSNIARGVHDLQYLRIHTDFPVGLFRSWTWLRFRPNEAQVIVYPKPKGTLPLPIALVDTGEDMQTQHLQGTDDFADVRDYRAGDNLRHVVWRRASMGKVSVKLFQANAGQQCVLDYHTLTQLDSEDRLSQLCQWVLDATQQGIAFSLVLPNKTIALNSGQQHQINCLEALACF